MMTYDYRYDYAGHFTADGVWVHPAITLPTWELIYMIAGTAYLYEEEQKIEAHAGEVVLFAPQKQHGGYQKSTEPVSFFWLHVYPGTEEADQALRELPACAQLLYPSQIAILFRQLLHHAQLKSYPPEMNDAFASLILLEYRSQSRHSDLPESRLLNGICEWIRVHISRPMTVQTVADQFQYHKDYLTRLFHASLGIGLKGYIDTVRMERIRDLLLTTDEPLKSIAAQTGFEDYKAFLKFFTYHESVSPTVFRAQYYKTHTNNR